VEEEGLEDHHHQHLGEEEDELVEEAMGDHQEQEQEQEEVGELGDQKSHSSALVEGLGVVARVVELALRFLS
jgi:hypothetical protein